ncbi:hypothetical protein ACM66B_004530 [Microbotryomycetes sp. NB124-2]
MSVRQAAKQTLRACSSAARPPLRVPVVKAGALTASYSSVAGPSRPRVQHAGAAPWMRMARRTMFIQTETTPNADSLKFIPGQAVSTSGTHEFLDAKSAAASPLADKLFHVPGVTSLFFGPDFISVNKSEDTPWADLKPEVYSIIMEHFTAGRPLFHEGSSSDGPEDTRILDTDSEVVAMIKELLDTRVRPAIQEDGGDIEYRGFQEEEGRVLLSLKGSCRGCDSSTVTLKNGIERMLMHYIPEVKEVEQIMGPEEQVAVDEFAKFEQRLRAEGKTVEL